MAEENREAGGLIMANKFTDAVFHAKVPAVDKAVLWALAHRTDNETGACYPSIKTIAKEAGCSVTITKEVIAYAVNIGLLSIQNRKEGNRTLANEYTISLKKLRWITRADERFLPNGETDQGTRASTAPSSLPAQGASRPGGGSGAGPGVGCLPAGGWVWRRLQNSEVDLRSRSRQSNSDSTAETARQKTQDTGQNPYINLGPDGCGGIRWQDKTNGSIWCSDLWWSKDPNLVQYPYGQPELAALMQASPTILHDKSCPCYPRHPRIVCICGLYEALLDPAHVSLPRPLAEQPCEGGSLHEWQEYNHTTARCSECGTCRTNPAVTQWTEADELEAEYMEMVECYDPDDTFWSATEEPKSTAANRAALSPSEFARAIGAVAHWD
jgi:hypothetical protein